MIAIFYILCVWSFSAFCLLMIEHDAPPWDNTADILFSWISGFVMIALWVAFFCNFPTHSVDNHPVPPQVEKAP